jgi:hypothetical protein
MMGPSLPTWAVVTVWTLIGVGICVAAARQRIQRPENRQPYNFRNILLLLLAGIAVAGVLLYLLVADSQVLKSRLGIYAIVLGGVAF